MPTLREIDADLMALESLLVEVGGDVTEEEAEKAVKEWFNTIKSDLNRKLDGYATVITLMKERAGARRDESRRLAELAKVDENAVARLRETLLWFMEKQGQQEIQTDFHRFRVANNGGKTPLTIKEAASPYAYKDTPYVNVVYEWNTDAIREALENGVELGFAYLQERGKHVRIK